ncbi:hypothetical protein BCR44DRAFT_1427872 [Catenaria anguillulae PL171]|uniref:Uncharacterized protein n=1 Tax=Catenaria anguillulae PL171 TaxID=765915 RepID=A0A1Y2I0A1_9FUNG|nr:hypothetical protein BCR44DRAFT_1427872 [Catenaria anguillulae PL171]
MTRDNDRLHDTISNLSAQLADLRDQLKVATALRDDSEAHLSVTSATQMAAAAEVARLTDRLANATKELESVRARLVSAETERDNVTRALGQSTEKCTILTAELDSMQLRLAVLEAQVSGARKDLGGEAEQAEELSMELLRVVQRQASVEKERREAWEQVRVLRMRLKEVETDHRALAKENERLVARIRELQTRPIRAGSPHASLASETFLSVAERVETELVGQLKSVQCELDAARARYREMGAAYRNRLQQYVDKTCSLNLANEMFSTIKTIVDSMLNDVIMSLMESEQHAHSCLGDAQSRLVAAHDLVVQLLHLAVILQDGKHMSGSDELAKLLASHQQFEKLMSVDRKQEPPATARPVKGGRVPDRSIPSAPSDVDATRKLAQEMIAKYIASTHSQLEQERSELLTRALVAEAAVKEWEAMAAKRNANTWQ